MDVSALMGDSVQDSASFGSSGVTASGSPAEKRTWRGAEFALCFAMFMALALHELGFVAQQTQLSLLAMLLFTRVCCGWAASGRDGAVSTRRPSVCDSINVLDSLRFWLRRDCGVLVVVAGGWMVTIAP